MWAGTYFNIATAPVYILLYHFGVEEHVEITLTLWLSGVAVGVLISGFLPDQENDIVAMHDRLPLDL